MIEEIPLRNLQNRRASILRWLGMPLCVLLLAGSLPAQMLVKPVNLAYLTQRADVIVRGRVARVVHESHPNYPNLPTIVVTVDVEDMMRGPSQKTYTFREILVGLRAKEGKKDYLVGQQMLLFLPSPSQYGLSSPIGMEQGRFHIFSTTSGSAMVTNETGNSGLFKDVALTAAKAGRRLTEKQKRIAATRRGPVELDDFVSLVKNLTALSRIQ